MLNSGDISDHSFVSSADQESWPRRIIPVTSTREGGITHITYSDGSEVWYKGKKVHRDDGPAYVSRTGKKWYCEGKVHRTDGPAIVHEDGTKFYFIHGEPCPPHVQSDDDLLLYLVHL